MLLEEGVVQTPEKAYLAVSLLELKFRKADALWAASECSGIDHAIALLQQECELCTETYGMNEMVPMLKCTHTCCKNCAKNYFTIQVPKNTRPIIL